MAVTRVTLRQIEVEGGRADRTRLDATSEAKIRRHMAEDSEVLDGEELAYERAVIPQVLRKRLSLTQVEFVALLRVPVAALRNWEQDRFAMEPAACTLLQVIDREPEAALRALRRGPPRAA